MKTRIESNYPTNQDCNLILQGHKYLLVKQINGLFYIYKGELEVGIFEEFDDAEAVWNLLESTSVELI